MAEFAPAFARQKAAQSTEYCLACYASYELGHLLEPRLHARLLTNRRLPLMQFGLCGSP
ncbi:MAG: hypothetical protein P8M25_09075 [Paracoccaceae bacterium]|nr:hypothetical protein [Paracoccaceae bacterium]